MKYLYMSIDYSHNYDDDSSLDKNLLIIFNPSIQIFKHIFMGHSQKVILIFSEIQFSTSQLFIGGFSSGFR